MITGIKIKNFKGIGDPGISIELAPVTMLFGGNSAGKSTVFHALLYAHEVLVKRNLNADQTMLGGGAVDLGGFLNFVHDHEPTKEVEIGFDLDISSAQLDHDWPMEECLVGTGANVVDLSSLGNDLWKSTIRFRVAWEPVAQKPFVRSFTVDVDDHLLLKTWRDADTTLVNAFVEYRHPVFRWPNASVPAEQSSAGVLDFLDQKFQTITDRYFWDEGVELQPEDLADDADLILGDPPIIETAEDAALYRMTEEVDGEAYVNLLYRYDLREQRPILECAFFKAGPEWNEDNARAYWERKLELNREDAFQPIRLIEQTDALPRCDRPMQLVLTPVTDPDYAASVDMIRNVVSRICLNPLAMLTEELKQFRHIGPLRATPTRQFQPMLSPDSSRWSAGVAAWDTLSTADEKLLDAVSDWLSSPEKLATGYSLRRKRFKELETDGFIMRLLTENGSLENWEFAVEELEKIQTRIRLTFLDAKGGFDQLPPIEVDPPDVAVGIIQLVPVVVAALAKHEGITLIEQPELHNHPSVEVGLGDLFAGTIRDTTCKFILETHGEHMLLRMLKRIRQTTDEELPDSAPKLSPDSIAVYFIEKTSSGVAANRIRIDETGEFIDRWPGGFFRERAEELF